MCHQHTAARTCEAVRFQRLHAHPGALPEIRDHRAEPLAYKMNSLHIRIGQGPSQRTQTYSVCPVVVDEEEV